MSYDYISVSLPKPLVGKIDRVIKDTNYGYSSRAEFIKEAIRIHLSKFQPFEDTPTA